MPPIIRHIAQEAREARTALCTAEAQLTNCRRALQTFLVYCEERRVELMRRQRRGGSGRRERARAELLQLMEELQRRRLALHDAAEERDHARLRANRAEAADRIAARM